MAKAKQSIELRIRNMVIGSDCYNKVRKSAYYEYKEYVESDPTEPCGYPKTVELVINCTSEILDYIDLPRFNDPSGKREYEIIDNELINAMRRGIDAFFYGMCPTCRKDLNERNSVSTERSSKEFERFKYLGLELFHFPRMCKDCYEDDMEYLRSAVKREKWEEIQRYEEAMGQCDQRDTCGVIKVHHDALEKDPERLTTSFMIGMACGAGGVRKYIEKRGDFTPSELAQMTDYELAEYLDNIENG